MAKIGPREARLRELAAAKAGRKAPKSGRTAASKAPARSSTPKTTPRAKKPPSQTPGAKVVPPSPRQGYSSDHPPAATPGPVTPPRFDRVLYQRVYTKLWHKNGRQGQSHWPAEDRATLHAVKTHPS
jgi:hypothetical protein